ncbi:Rho termination factor N-terminal domain-containing protein, partial [Clavibacter michiganensis]|uniref:Rho termination factor N-terminal domain-containing protein n=1 Tax=Clavibacter michiganensis TaxID=28447 RepID=UPI00292D3A44
MTDVDTRATTADLSALRVSQLQAIASELGIPGGSKLRKGELVTAISEIQAAGGTTAPADETAPEAAAVHVAAAVAPRIDSLDGWIPRPATASSRAPA